MHISFNSGLERVFSSGNRASENEARCATLAVNRGFFGQKLKSPWDKCLGNLLTSVVACVLLMLCPLARGAELIVEVKDSKGALVENAVVVFTPASGTHEVAKKNMEIVQQDKEFSPLVTIIPLGSTVQFPNRDTVGHHVYSFSAAKKFDLPLYTGETTHKVIFDKEGVVTLGCNIHDWMVAHLYVTSAPFYTLSGADGRAVLQETPAGSGILRVWHPRLRGEEVTVSVKAGDKAPVVVPLSLRPELKRRRAPAPSGGGGYR